MKPVTYLIEGHPYQRAHELLVETEPFSLAKLVDSINTISGRQKSVSYLEREPATFNTLLSYTDSFKREKITSAQSKNTLYYNK